MNAINKSLVVAVLLALAGCGTPETQCREGVSQMKGRLVGVIGSDGHQQASDPIVQAHTQLDMAQTQLATGNFEGCLGSLEEARGLLNRSQRTNQE